MRRDMEQSALERIASLVDELPALPIVAQQSLAMISDPSTEPEELQAVLSRDPALSLKLLRLANSAYYRRNRRVATLNTAIVMLGFKTIQTLVLSSAVHRVLAAADSRAKSLWLHCFGTALACRELCKRASSNLFGHDEAFLAGLFHDVAKGVIVSKFPGVYSRPVGPRGESEILGFHHGDLGRVLLERWEIPANLTEAVGTHHDPTPQGLGRIVRVGDWLAWSVAEGLGAPLPEPPGELMEALGLDAACVEQARGSVKASLAEEGSDP